MSRHVGPQGLAMFDALVLAAALYWASLPAVAQHRLPAAIFDSDPNHIWNTSLWLIVKGVNLSKWDQRVGRERAVNGTTEG